MKIILNTSKYLKFLTGAENLKRGFSMIESLVAIAVLLVAIVGPLTIAINSIQYSNVAKDKLQATYLAQEQIELLVARQHTIFIECYIGVPSLDNDGSVVNNVRANCYDVKNNAVQSGENSDLAVKGEAFKEFYDELVSNANPENKCNDGCFVDVNTFKYDSYDMNSVLGYNIANDSSCDVYVKDDTSAANIDDPMFLCNQDSANGWTKTKFTRKLKVEKIPNSLPNSIASDFENGSNTTIERQDQILITSEVTYTMFGIPRTITLESLVSMIQ